MPARQHGSTATDAPLTHPERTLTGRPLARFIGLGLLALAP